VPREALAPGDRCPNFVLPDAKGEFRAFYERVRGRPAVMLFVPENAAATLLGGFAARAAAFDQAGYDIFAIVHADAAVATRESARLDNAIVVLADPKGAVTRGYAAGSRFNPEFPACFLIDANQRMLTRRNTVENVGSELADWALRLLGDMAPVETSRTCGQVAPVLILPLVLDPHMCAALIDRWESEGHEEGAVTSIVDGKEVTRVHDPLKRRRDHAIQDPIVLKSLAATIGRRIAPELVKAFHFDAFKFDRFVITCYDAERGDYFHAHRDNESASTSDRRFALTLNLNTGDYEGGELVFPEYGPHRYAPPAGGAIVFSCSLLHEALPVTKGRRFTLLSFLSAPARSAVAPQPDPAPAPQPPSGFNPGPAAPGTAAPGGFNPGGFNPGASPAAGSPAAKPGGTVPFAPGMPSKNGLTRAGD
jgi:predicted 2-oxoglutarate/Fe(II)-dependent dioxygenase YbiX/peroxiredoxin